jgi:hypothetical protein
MPRAIPPGIARDIRVDFSYMCGVSIGCPNCSTHINFFEAGHRCPDLAVMRLCPSTYGALFEVQPCVVCLSKIFPNKALVTALRK